MYYFIYGERSSGTNILNETIKLNFEDDLLVCDMNKKHFFNFTNIENVEDCLYISIVRDPVDWINSLYRNPHLISHELFEDKIKFISSEFKTWHKNPKEKNSIFTTKIKNPRDQSYIEVDTENLDGRHIYTGQIYRNVFEMRHIKLKFMCDDMPKLLSNYIIIKYEDLIHNFENTMNKLKCAGLTPKCHNFTQIDIDKPVKPWMYCKPCRELNVTYDDFIPEFEKKFGYIINDKTINDCIN